MYQTQIPTAEDLPPTPLHAPPREADLLHHLDSALPSQAAFLGASARARLARAAMDRGGEHGLTTAPGLVIYLGLMLSLGWRFDQDPQLPWAAEALAAGTGQDPFERVCRCRERAVVFLEQVLGPAGRYFHDAANRLCVRGPESLTQAADPLGADLIGYLSWLHPQRSQAVGPAALAKTVTLGRQRAAARGITGVHGVAAWITCMYLLGAGFDDDPMFTGLTRFLGRACDERCLGYGLERIILETADH